MSKKQKRMFQSLMSSLWTNYTLIGKSIKYNQLAPKSLSSSTSVVPTANKCGSYITIINPIVGHKVYARLKTSNTKLRVCWYINGNSGYDFVSGSLLNESSTESSVFEGVYEITQEMVHSGTGYLQLYYWIYSGLETGTKDLELQLVDLTALGMENIINPTLFNATDLGKLMAVKLLDRTNGDIYSTKSPFNFVGRNLFDINRTIDVGDTGVSGGGWNISNLSQNAYSHFNNYRNVEVEFQGNKIIYSTNANINGQGVELPIKVKPNTKYNLSYISNFDMIIDVFQYNNKGVKLANLPSNNILTSSDTYWLVLRFRAHIIGASYEISNIMLEEGTTAHNYEPYINKTYEGTLYNQLVENGNFADTSIWGGSTQYFSVANNVGTLSQTGDIRQSINLTVGHKYLLTADVYGKSNNQMLFAQSIGNARHSNTTDFTWEKLSFIFTSSLTSGSFRILNNEEEMCKFKNFMLIDLTIDKTDYMTLDQALVHYGREYLPYTGNSQQIMPLILNETDTFATINGLTTRKFGIKDLGNMSWVYETNTERLVYRTRDLYDLMGGNNYEGSMPKMICPKYTTYKTTFEYRMAEVNYGNIFLRAGTYQVNVRNDTFGGDAQAFKTANIGVPLYYELATPYTEKNLSIALPYGITKITDASGLEMDFEKEYVDIYSLLGEQDVETTGNNRRIFSRNDGSFLYSNSNLNSKQFNVINGNKYFVLFNFSSFVSGYIGPTSHAQLFVNNTLTGLGNETLSKLGDNDFGCIINATGTNIANVSVYNNGVGGESTTKFALVIDLTELKLDHLTAEQVYNLLKNKLDILASGNVVRLKI